MSLEKKIQEEMKIAMRAKDKTALQALRAIKSAILLAKTASGGDEPMSEADEMKLLIKQAKQRRDSATQFRDNGRDDLAVVEEAELKIIERFLPQQMSEEEVKAEVEAIIAQVGATSMKDMGKVMGIASKKLAGKADGKTISSIVKATLG